jgi:hypothetical protein
MYFLMSKKIASFWYALTRSEIEGVYPNRHRQALRQGWSIFAFSCRVMVTLFLSAPAQADFHWLSRAAENFFAPAWNLLPVFYVY